MNVIRPEKIESIGETALGTSNKSLTAGFMRSW